MPLRVRDLPAGALAHVPADVDDVDAMTDVDLAQVQLVQHRLDVRAVGHVLRVAPQAHADDDPALEGEPPLLALERVSLIEQIRFPSERESSNFS